MEAGRFRKFDLLPYLIIVLVCFVVNDVYSAAVSPNHPLYRYRMGELAGGVVSRSWREEIDDFLPMVRCDRS